MPVILLKDAPSTNPHRASRAKEGAWWLLSLLLVQNPLVRGSRIRRGVLRMFGARIGRGLVAPWPIRVHMPWNLSIGDDCWLGHGAWLHNQGPLFIGSNVVVSQDAMVSTGSHDVRKDMGLVIKPVHIEDGAWITSRVFVSPGARVGRNAVVTPNSVVVGTLEPDTIYSGNPARAIAKREIRLPPGRDG